MLPLLSFGLYSLSPLHLSHFSCITDLEVSDNKLPHRHLQFGEGARQVHRPSQYREQRPHHGQETVISSDVILCDPVTGRGERLALQFTRI